MPFIEVNSGAPDIPDGVYPVTVTAISDIKTVTAKQGAKAGQDVDLIDWSFAVELPTGVVEIEDSTSTASGPRSKMFAWLTALRGGQPPVIGQQFEKTDLIGRMAQAQFQRDQNGWPRITAMLAMSPQQLAQQIGAATGAPLSATLPAAGPIAAAAAAQPAVADPDPAGTFVGAPAQQPVDPAAGNLPF